MPPSPTDYPSMITVENTNNFIPSVIFPREIYFFLSRVAVCKTVGVPSVVVFFIADKISDEKRNY
jgi:hypothetical protein